MNLKELQKIPGVGPRFAQILWDLGFESVASLKNADPEGLFDRFCQQEGCYVDRCVLYVFRCVVYFASNEEHEESLLKWWNWKD